MGTSMFLGRIALALALGAAIGLERQLTGHVAGIRINVLISMGACFFMLFPQLYASDEIFRLGASIVQGVGFLCSGVILKDGASVRGLNTAATLWCTAAVGILASTGEAPLAVAATAALVLANLLLRPVALRIGAVLVSDDAERRYRVSITCREDAEQAMRLLLVNAGIHSRVLHLANLDSGDVVGEKVEIVAEYRTATARPRDGAVEAVVSSALEVPAVANAGWEEL